MLVSSKEGNKVKILNSQPTKQKDNEMRKMKMKFNKLMALTLMAGASLSMQSLYAADNSAEDLLNLEVTESGIYQVTHDQLLDFGLNINGESVDRIALMNAGQPLQIEVTGSDADETVFGEGASIRFVGKGLDTLYTDTNVYTLRLDNEAAIRIAADSSVPQAGAFANSYLATKSYSPQNKYSFVSPNKADPWYSERLLASGEAVDSTTELDLDYYVPGGNQGQTKAKLFVNVWGASDLPGTNDHDVDVSFNGVRVTSATFNGMQEKTLNSELDNVRENRNSIKVELPLTSGQSYDLVHLNTVEVKYPRAFVADGSELQFSSSHQKFAVQGFESDQISVYRKGSDGIAKLTSAVTQGSCAQGTPGCAVFFAGSGSLADYYAVTDNALKSPSFALLPLNDDIKSGSAEYLIISHPDFIDAPNQGLQSLVTKLSSEFSSVDLVNVENVYEQFGNHIFGAEAIQNYIRYAAQSRGSKYVLLVGGDIYDYRQFQNENARSFIPSLYAPTDGVVNFAPVDAKYVDLDDDNVPDLSIGRLPIRTAAELDILLTKRDQYINRDYAGTALFAADKYDAGQQYSFSDDADKIQQDYFQAWNTTKAYVDTNGVQSARNEVVNKINAGQSLTSFFGHSSTNQWSFSGLFTGNDAAALDNSGKPTVVTQWGCWNTYYVDPSEESMGHRFMVEGDRGALAVMGASTWTSANNERELAEMVFAKMTNGVRVGDAILQAKQEYAQINPDALDVLLGWTLLGMPELVVN